MEDKRIPKYDILRGVKKIKLHSARKTHCSGYSPDHKVNTYEMLAMGNIVSHAVTGHRRGAYAACRPFAVVDYLFYTAFDEYPCYTDPKSNEAFEQLLMVIAHIALPGDDIFAVQDAISICVTHWPAIREAVSIYIDCPYTLFKGHRLPCKTSKMLRCASRPAFCVWTLDLTVGQRILACSTFWNNGWPQYTALNECSRVLKDPIMMNGHFPAHYLRYCAKPVSKGPALERALRDFSVYVDVKDRNRASITVRWSKPTHADVPIDHVVPIYAASTTFTWVKNSDYYDLAVRPKPDLVGESVPCIGKYSTPDVAPDPKCGDNCPCNYRVDVDPDDMASCALLYWCSKRSVDGKCAPFHIPPPTTGDCARNAARGLAIIESDNCIVDSFLNEVAYDSRGHFKYLPVGVAGRAFDGLTVCADDKPAWWARFRDRFTRKVMKWAMIGQFWYDGEWHYAAGVSASLTHRTEGTYIYHSESGDFYESFARLVFWVVNRYRARRITWLLQVEAIVRIIPRAVQRFWHLGMMIDDIMPLVGVGEPCCYSAEFLSPDAAEPWCVRAYCDPRPKPGKWNYAHKGYNIATYGEIKDPKMLFAAWEDAVPLPCPKGIIWRNFGNQAKLDTAWPVYDRAFKVIYDCSTCEVRATMRRDGSVVSADDIIDCSAPARGDWVNAEIALRSLIESHYAVTPLGDLIHVSRK